MYNMENSIEVKFWIELETTVDNMNEFTKSEDCRVVAEILKNILLMQLFVLKQK